MKLRLSQSALGLRKGHKRVGAVVFLIELFRSGFVVVAEV